MHHEAFDEKVVITVDHHWEPLKLDTLKKQTAVQNREHCSDQVSVFTCDFDIDSKQNENNDNSNSIDNNSISITNNTDHDVSDWKWNEIAQKDTKWLIHIGLYLNKKHQRFIKIQFNEIKDYVQIDNVEFFGTYHVIESTGYGKPISPIALAKGLKRNEIVDYINAQ